MRRVDVRTARSYVGSASANRYYNSYAAISKIAAHRPWVPAEAMSPWSAWRSMLQFPRTAMREKVDSHQLFRHLKYPGATLHLEMSTLSIRKFPEARYVDTSNT